jgi:glycosyltransferase involved in cell wall biosynthesis
LLRDSGTAANPMKIAQIAPLVESIPPRGYGGTERVVAYLADALVERGHDVTLYTSADASTKAKVVAVRDEALRLDPSPLKSDLAAHLAMLGRVRAHAAQFDVLHFHIDLVHFPFFEHIAYKTVTTLHGRLDVKDLPAVYRCWPQYPLVSISDAQRKPLAFANWIATVHHGIPAEVFRCSPTSDDYVVFVGRISPEKRPDRAIAIARRAGVPLKIAAKVDPADASYFHKTIEPLLDGPGVEFIGELDESRKNELVAGARALLFPIDWPEPFGLVMIESMACGTPVLAWDCGSVPEVVDDGVTGFIVSSEDQAVDALRRIGQLDRMAVRATFERRFSTRRMAEDYLGVYSALARRAPRELLARK